MTQTPDTTMITQSMENDVKQKPLSFKLLLRLYYLPFLIFVLGFGLYYFIFRLYTYDIDQDVNPNLANETAIPLESAPIAAVPATEPTAELPMPIIMPAPAAETQAPAAEAAESVATTEPTAPNLVNASTFVVDVRSLNVRNKPVSGAPIIAAISRGDVIEVAQQENGWAQIDVNGTRGWVTTRFLRPLDSNVAAAPAPENVGTVYAVIADSINVREQPSTRARVVGKKLQNDSIVALEEKNGWVRTQEGWIYKNLLKLKGE